ncbi:uncharacterized, partial [Tachysurus ichikawai]
DSELIAVLRSSPETQPVGLTTFDLNASYQNNQAPNDIISQLVQPEGT